MNFIPSREVAVELHEAADGSRFYRHPTSGKWMPVTKPGTFWNEVKIVRETEVGSPCQNLPQDDVQSGQRGVATSGVESVAPSLVTS